jgi:hypothetical protein
MLLVLIGICGIYKPRHLAFISASTTINVTEMWIFGFFSRMASSGSCEELNLDLNLRRVVLALESVDHRLRTRIKLISIAHVYFPSRNKKFRLWVSHTSVRLFQSSYRARNS